MKIYSLRKCKHILRHTYHLFQKKKSKMPFEAHSLMQQALVSLEKEVMHENQEKADELAKQIESLSAIHLKKSGWDSIRELLFSLTFALVVAVVVRQIWFEFYEIPSGSMRPTFKEQDRLVVSKTDFGINIPLRPAEFYFDPDI